MIQEINIIDLMQKTSKKGQNYLSLKTDIGNMSCWLPELFNKMFAGQRYKVVTETKNGFINILEISQDMGNSPIGVKILEPFIEAREDKAHLMLNSYMKDQVVACINAGAVKGTDFDINALWELAYKNITDAYKKLREEFK